MAKKRIGKTKKVKKVKKTSSINKTEEISNIGASKNKKKKINEI